MFLIVVGAKLWLIDQRGSEVPILDQWAAEGAFPLKPWVQGSLRLRDLFVPHNEHRIVDTRLWTLLWFELDGQWDPFLEIVANAFLVGCITVVFAHCAARLMNGRERAYGTIGVALWAALPYGQENALWGFQSQFYFLIVFSLLFIAATLTWKPNRAVIVTGLFSGMLALFTIASGLLCAAAVVVVIVLRLATRRCTLRQAVINVAIPFGVLLAGWLLRAPPVPHHAAFAAHSFARWATLFGRCLAWPFCNFGPMALLIYLPAVLLGIAYFRRDRADQRFAANAELLIAVSAWVALQAAAISYGRAGLEVQVASRYTDIMAIGALVNFCALLILLAHRADNWGERLARRLAGDGWIVLILFGACSASATEFAREVGRRPYMENAVTVARQFISTRDIQLLKAPGLLPIPYPNAETIAELLGDPTIQTILPPAIRPPLHLTPAAAETAFVSNGLPPEVSNKSQEHVWGSYSDRGTRATGIFTSQPVVSRYPYLRFEIAGYMRPGLALRVDDTASGRKRNVIPTTRIDDQWRAAYLHLAEGTHTVFAEDARDDQWFAFREPRECGRLSYYAIRVARCGRNLVIGGAVLLLVLLRGDTWRNGRDAG